MNCAIVFIVYVRKYLNLNFLEEILVLRWLICSDFDIVGIFAKNGIIFMLKMF